MRVVEQRELAVEERVRERTAVAESGEPRVGLAPRVHLAHGRIEPRALGLVARLARRVGEPERLVVLELERLELADELLDEARQLALARAGRRVGGGHGESPERFGR